ncbi:Response regulator MprA [Anaerolineae bacterium]|nr:Response regulator MprA [Anaerolineae bacterium]
MNVANILIISRDQTLGENISRALESIPSHHLTTVNEVDHAGRLPLRPDLTILDLNNSATACQKLRNIPGFNRVPILCLVGGSHEVVTALDAGGDDCVRKPIIARELAARVRALLRRINREDGITLFLEVTSRQARLVGKPLDLTPTEFDLLDMLCQNPGVYLNASDLLQKVWSYPPGTGDPALVRNHIRNLRRKIERDPERPRIITSAHGRGYTISADFVRK